MSSLTNRVGSMGCQIALSGKMMSGKSTVAQYLVREHGFVEVAFAEELTEIAVRLFRYSSQQPKNRALLQTLGMRMREIDPDVWVEALLRRLSRLPEDCNIVVSDVRFPNEYVALRERGYWMARVYIDPELQELRVHQSTPNMPRGLLCHYSEVALDGPEWPWDSYIVNDNSVDNLISQVEAIHRMLT